VISGWDLGFDNSSLAWTSSWSGSDGQRSSVNRRNSGPFHHVSLSRSFDALHPLEGKSAGFRSPGQNFQSSTFVSSRMLLTWIWTYVFHALLFRIQHKTVCESVHSTTRWRTGNDVMALCTELMSRASITVPNNSNLGMDCFLTGETLVFEATNLTSVPPYTYSVRKYITAAYALHEVSENPCSSNRIGLFETVR
jgi:hypothetical protein